MTTSDRVHQLVSTVQQTQASSPPHEEETVEETDLGLEIEVLLMGERVWSSIDTYTHRLTSSREY